MPLPGPLAALNWIDWGVVLVLLGSASAGVRRGFLLGVLDLLSMVAASSIALWAAAPVSSAVTAILPGVPPSLAAVGVAAGVWAAAEGVYLLVVRALLGVLRPFLLALAPLGCINQPLGLIPGFVKGALVALVLLLPFAVVPIVPPVSSTLEQSTLGSRLVGLALRHLGAFEAQVGTTPPSCEAPALSWPPCASQGAD